MCRVTLVTFVLGVLASACGGDPASMVDGGPDGADAAGPPGPCWSDSVPRVPHGSLELGTGVYGFEAMPDVLPLAYGAQDGFMLFANVQMTGFPPGNPANILDPANPRTRIRAFFADTGVPLNYYARCPNRVGYEPAADGSFELVEAIPVIFETCWRSNHLFGARIHIIAEILELDGRYARDEKIVTAAPPAEPHAVDQDAPGCKHSLEEPPRWH